MLAEELKKVLVGYGLNATKNFAYNDFTAIVTSEIPALVQSQIDKNRGYIYKGSVGQGNWAEIPWIAVLTPTLLPLHKQGITFVILLIRN